MTRAALRPYFWQVLTLCAAVLTSPGALGQTSGRASIQSLAGIPGMDFSRLNPAAQSQLATVFTDEFCYCGCPHTLEVCLKSHPPCRHAKRMASLAAQLAEQGALGPEIILSLGTFYQSFTQARAPYRPDPRQCKGPANARVTLVEFFDYECPGCGAARPLLERFLTVHPEVRLCAAPFPLTMHPNALPAGQAALYARDHGKFWAMHDLLFENQRHLSTPFIVELAGKAGLNMVELRKVLESGKYLEELKGSQKEGVRAGVDMTPTLFMNGRKHALGLTPEVLAHAVEDEQEWTSNHNAWGAD